MAKKRGLNAFESDSKTHTKRHKINETSSHEPPKTNFLDNILSESIGSTNLLPKLPPITSPALEKAVFTHEGLVSNPTNHRGSETNYERLEFLGDAYLELIASKTLFRRFPQRKAGKLSSMRETLVKNETLNRFAREYDFVARLQAEKTVLDAVQSKQRDRKLALKVSADMFEAYVAAVVLSAQEEDPKGGEERGLCIVTAWLTQLWEPILRAWEQESGNRIDAKQELSKRVICPGLKLEYVEAQPPRPQKDTPGKIVFSVKVLLNGLGYEKKYLGSGSGQSKNEAGWMAATEALENHDLMEELQQKKQIELALRGTSSHSE